MQTFSHRSLLSFATLLLGLAAGCTAPRTIFTSGKVTPVGEIRGGSNFIINIPTNTIGRLADVTADAVRELNNEDTISFAQNEKLIDNLQKGAISYALDPLGTTQDFYLRYGVARRFDLGARVAAGAFVVDGQYQLWGSTADWRNPSGERGGHGSIGLMLSTQTADLPGREALDIGGKLLNFGGRRTDVLVPFTFSAPLGKEEEFGHVAAGLVVGRSFVRYKFAPSQRFVDQAGARLDLPEINEKHSFMTWGAFINGRFGYRYVYVIPALAIYYQNYGEFKLLNNRSARLKGTTIVPSLGIQICIPTKRGK